MDFKIEGGKELKQISKALRQVGDKELSKEFSKGVSGAGKKMAAHVAKELPGFVPDRYAAELGPRLRMRTTRRTGRNPRVDIVFKSKTKRGAERSLGQLEQGNLRHPLHGNRGHWYGQRVTPGFVSGPMTKRAPLGRREIENVMRDIERKIIKKAG